MTAGGRAGGVLVLVLASASCSRGGDLAEPTETVRTAVEVEVEPLICFVIEYDFGWCANVATGQDVSVDLAGGAGASEPP